MGGSANTVLHYEKEGTLTGPDKEHPEISMPALHSLQSTLVHVNTLPVQQALRRDDELPLPAVRQAGWCVPGVG